MCCSYEHGHVKHADGAETYPAVGSRYCKCLGLAEGHYQGDPANLGFEGKCCGAASGDDGLCDRCRKTCNQKVEGAADAVAEDMSQVGELAEVAG